MIRLTVTLGIMCFAAGSALAQTSAPNSIPILRIKSAFSGPIWRVDTNADQSHVVVSSSYNTISSWSVDTPDQPNLIRLPLRLEQQKRARAVALSPSGELAAFSVPPLTIESNRLVRRSSLIYIIRVSSGEIVQVLGRESDEIDSRPQAMRFSPDGRFLVTLLSSGCGARVWSTSNWNLTDKDDAGYGNIGGGTGSENRCCKDNDITTCDALPDGNSVEFYQTGESRYWLVASSDTGLRVYDLTEGRLERKVFVSPEQLGLERPGGVSISPDGAAIAVGERGRPSVGAPMHLRVAVVDSMSLRPISILQVDENSLIFPSLLNTNVGDLYSQFNLDRVAWLTVGSAQYVFAGSVPCQIIKGDLIYPPSASLKEICVVRWALGRQDTPTFFPAGTDRIADIIPLRRKGGIFIASQRLVTALDENGMPLISASGNPFLKYNTAADFRDPDLDFGISPDSKVVAFRDYRSSAGTRVGTTFDVSAVPNPLRTKAETTPVYLDPVIVGSWRNSRAVPQLRGVALPIVPGKDEIFRSAALLPGKNWAVFGSSESLRLFSYQDDVKLLCEQPITEEAYRVNVSLDGKKIVSAHSDGTIRWYQIDFSSEGKCRFKLLLSAYLFQTPSGQWSWVAWNPTGTHAEALGAQNVLEWQVRGADDFQIVRTPFERLQGWYNPLLISHSLDSALLEENAGPDRTTVVQNSPPKNSIEVKPTPGSSSAASSTVRLTLGIGDLRGWPKTISVRANNTRSPIILAGTSRAPTSEISVLQSDLRDGTIQIDISLPTNVRTTRADVQLCFYVNDLLDACHVIAWTGDISKPQKRRLWAVLVGVAKYADDSLKLQFAGNDAIDLATLFVSDQDWRSKGRLPKQFLGYGYDQVHINLAVSDSDDSERDIRRIASTHPYLKIYKATRQGIIDAIKDMMEQRRTDPSGEDLGDDLFMFYFSGHGAINPAPMQQGRAILATASLQGPLTRENVDANAISSLELASLFEAIPGSKLLLFDACRSIVPSRDSPPFDPALVKSELETHQLSADLYFSSDAGQASREVPGLAYNSSRPLTRRGNGLFTYALLRAMTTNATLLQPVRASVVRVTIPAIDNYFSQIFFNTDSPTSDASLLMQKRQWSSIQTPKYIPARWRQGSEIIRIFQTK